MMRIRLGYVLAMLLSVLVAAATGRGAEEDARRSALNQDPDILDPTLSRTYVGRIIYAHMCEKLYEIDENLKISPQLAAELPGVRRRGQDRHDQAALRGEVQRRHRR